MREEEGRRQRGEEGAASKLVASSCESPICPQLQPPPNSLHTCQQLGHALGLGALLQQQGADGLQQRKRALPLPVCVRGCSLPALVGSRQLGHRSADALCTAVACKVSSWHLWRLASGVFTQAGSTTNGNANEWGRRWRAVRAALSGLPAVTCDCLRISHLLLLALRRPSSRSSRCSGARRLCTCDRDRRRAAPGLRHRRRLLRAACGTVFGTCLLLRCRRHLDQGGLALAGRLFEVSLHRLHHFQPLGAGVEPAGQGRG